MADDVQHLTSDGVVCCPNDEFPTKQRNFSATVSVREATRILAPYSAIFTKCYIFYSLMFISFILTITHVFSPHNSPQSLGSHVRDISCQQYI